LLDVSQVLLELFEPVLPHLSVSPDPLDRVVERRGLQAAGPVLGVLPSCDQPRALQHLQVLGNRLEAHVERLGELVHGGLAGGEPGEDRSACRVGEGCERDAERVVGQFVFYQSVDKPVG
jgi:hypothetical protein